VAVFRISVRSAALDAVLPEGDPRGPASLDAAADRQAGRCRTRRAHRDSGTAALVVGDRRCGVLHGVGVQARSLRVPGRTSALSPLCARLGRIAECGTAANRNPGRTRGDSAPARRVGHRPDTWIEPRSARIADGGPPPSDRTHRIGHRDDGAGGPALASCFTSVCGSRGPARVLRRRDHDWLPGLRTDEADQKAGTTRLRDRGSGRPRGDVPAEPLEQQLQRSGAAARRDAFIVVSEEPARPGT